MQQTRWAGRTVGALLVAVVAACAFRTGGPPRSPAAPVAFERTGPGTVGETTKCISSRLSTTGMKIVRQQPGEGAVLATTEEEIPGTVVRGGRLPDQTIHTYVDAKVSPASDGDGTVVIEVTAVSTEDRLESDEDLESIESPLRISEEVRQTVESTLAICTDSSEDAG